MSTFIDYIKIKSNNDNDVLLPITKEKAVIDDDGVRLDYKLDDITQRCENVEKKIHLVQTAKGTPNDIILNNMEFVDGFYTNFVILEDNDGLTTINEKPLYKPNTYQSPTLIKGEAVTAWYDEANDCFFIKDSDSKTDFPDNLVYFSEGEHQPTSAVPRDSELLGGESRSYYEQLVQDVHNMAKINLSSINTLNEKIRGVGVTDLNNVSGFQVFFINVNTLNAPVAFDGMGVQLEYGEYVCQIVFGLGTNNIYHRTRYGTWRSWKIVSS